MKDSQPIPPPRSPAEQHLTMSGALDWLSQAKRDRQSAGLWRHLATRESPPVAGQIQIDGQPFVNFSSNDYLGLAADSRLVDAMRHAAGQVGVGSGASPLVTGRGTLHNRLEKELADWKQAAAALLFPTGYAANLGTLTSLVGPGDVVFSDALNHASIIDACRLSRANIVVYQHNDVDHLARGLHSARSCRRRLIVTDTVFSMDGDFAPLDQLAELADEHKAMLMIDEAHATGVLGSSGGGLAEHLGIQERIDARVGTMSKALGTHGGFVVGSRPLIEWIGNSARSYIFSTAAPEPIAAASLAALNIVRNESERRQRLLERAHVLRMSLRKQGWNVGASESQIIPLIVGSSERAIGLATRLRQEGFWVPAIRPPTVPDGAARLRISLCSQHTDQQLDRLETALARFVQK